MRSDERAIRELHAAWIDAVNAGDPGRLLDMTTDDVMFLSPGEPGLGRDGFSAKFSEAHRRLRIRCDSALEDVVVAGEVAYTTSRDALTLSPRDGGEEARFAGDRLTIYRKPPGGNWLLARDANLLSPAGRSSDPGSD